MLKDVAAKWVEQNAQRHETTAKSSDEPTALHRRYGEIGISAVAAAVRYQGATRNPAYARVDDKSRDFATAA